MSSATTRRPTSRNLRVVTTTVPTAGFRLFDAGIGAYVGPWRATAAQAYRDRPLVDAYLAEVAG